MLMGLWKFANTGKDHLPKKELLPAVEDQPSEGVWPPAPRNPQETAGLEGKVSIEKLLASGLSAIILGAVIALILAKNWVTDLFAFASVILLCSLAGYIWMRSRPAVKPSIEVHYGEPEEGVWPPPPTTKPGTESAGLE